MDDGTFNMVTLMVQEIQLIYECWNQVKMRERGLTMLILINGHMYMYS